VESTNPNPTGSTNHLIFFEGYGSPCTNLADANLTLTHDTAQLTQLTNSNNWGYAYQYTPAGATNPEYTGGAHFNEAIATVSWLDGADADVSVSVGTPVQSADLIKLVQTGTARHSETGVTDIADVDMTIFFDYQGHHQEVTHTWLVAGVMNHGYIGMFPGHTTLLKGAIAGSPTVYILTDDDDSEKGQVRSRLAALFDATHSFVASVYVSGQEDVDFWAYSSLFCHFDDKAGGVNKIYFHVWTPAIPRNWAAGEVWSKDFWYQFAYKPDFIP
jgi:hypothetical protein